MTPLALAQNLARSGDHKNRTLAVAIVARGLSDDDPSTFRQGWPLVESVNAAIAYLGLDRGPDAMDLAAEALTLAPTLSDAILNNCAATR